MSSFFEQCCSVHRFFVTLVTSGSIDYPRDPSFCRLPEADERGPSSQRFPNKKSASDRFSRHKCSCPASKTVPRYLFRSFVFGCDFEFPISRDGILLVD